MWRSKSCIIEMFLAFYETHHRPESSYRDFLQEVLSVYEEWKNSHISSDDFKRLTELSNGDSSIWNNLDSQIDAETSDEMQFVMKTEPFEDTTFPADKENESNSIAFGLADSESFSSVSSLSATAESNSAAKSDPYSSHIDPPSRRRWKRTDVLSCIEGTHKCQTCHRRFRNLTMLERHKIRHLVSCASADGIVGLRCPECQLVFPTRASFMRHSFQHHSQSLNSDKTLGTYHEGETHSMQISGKEIEKPELDGELPPTVKEECDKEFETIVENSKEEAEENCNDAEEHDKDSKGSEDVSDELSKSECFPASTHVNAPDVISSQASTTESELPLSSINSHSGADVPSNVLTNSLQHNLPPFPATNCQAVSGPSRRCPVCGKGISNKNNWERHLLIHTGVKPFKCRHCGKAFNRKDNLATHEKKHTKHMQQQLTQHPIDQSSDQPSQPLDSHIEETVEKSYQKQKEQEHTHLYPNDQKSSIQSLPQQSEQQHTAPNFSHQHQTSQMPEIQKPHQQGKQDQESTNFQQQEVLSYFQRQQVSNYQQQVAGKTGHPTSHHEQARVLTQHQHSHVQSKSGLSTSISGPLTPQPLPPQALVQQHSIHSQHQHGHVYPQYHHRHHHHTSQHQHSHAQAQEMFGQLQHSM